MEYLNKAKKIATISMFIFNIAQAGYVAGVTVTHNNEQDNAHKTEQMVLSALKNVGPAQAQAASPKANSR